MQFTRFISLVTLFSSFGLLALSVPVPVSQPEERCLTGLCGVTSGGSPLTVLTSLQVKVKADVAVVAALVAKASVDVNAYTAAYATLVADVNAAVGVLAALPAAEAGLSASLISGAAADILLDIFAGVQSCSSIPSISTCYGGLDDALLSLVTKLNLCASGVLSLIANLCLGIKVTLNLNVNANVFAGLLGCFNPLWS